MNIVLHVVKADLIVGYLKTLYQLINIYVLFKYAVVNEITNVLITTALQCLCPRNAALLWSIALIHNFPFPLHSACTYYFYLPLILFSHTLN
jgi:hypothetical protein